jgi:hypothetical protein
VILRARHSQADQAEEVQEKLGRRLAVELANHAVDAGVAHGFSWVRCMGPVSARTARAAVQYGTNPGAAGFHA